MKKLKIGIAMLFVLCSMFSCIDSDYHWDNLNKEGVLEVPPVPLGSFPAIVIEDLFEEALEIKDLPIGTYSTYYTFENLFGDKSVKNFFHKDAKRDIVLSGKLDFNMLGWDNELAIKIKFYVLDHENKIIDDIDVQGSVNDGETISDEFVIEHGVQKLAIKIKKEDSEKMREAAEHLQMKIILETPKNITLKDGDYIKLSEMLITTAGYHFEL